jgi:hypothetical protein
VQTLTLTDIATGWTECAPLLVREQKLLTEVLSEVRRRMPFALLGFDTDNDSVFMNATVKTYCEEAGLVFTRCRPYRKNDQAWVEQKNGVVVRRTVGYRRYEGLEAAAALARLYSSLRLFVNFFQPSFKLAGKIRDGAKVKKKYHPPATPYQRLLADARINEEVRRRVMAIHATLDPVQLLQTIRACQQELVEIADRPTSGEAMPPTATTTEQFLAGLRIAWQEGEVRPTSKPKEKARRGRRRPDPFVTVTALMRGWFEAEPWRTSRKLFERLLKTIFLCRHLNDEALRREINDGLNVIEHWNSANDFVFFARRGELGSNRREDQELSMLSLHLLQNCMVFINTLMLQQVLARSHWSDRLTPRDQIAITPLIWDHVNPYGRFELDMDSRIPVLT